MSFLLTSPAFAQGRPIPRDFAKEGRNVSPTLTWTDPPPGTASYALICDDPDAPRGTFTHWVAFNLPAIARELAEGVPQTQELPNGTVQGKNDFGEVGYGGPKPPPGGPHRYFFKLYALDAMLSLRAGASKQELLDAMQGHVLAEAQLMGTFQHGQQPDLPDNAQDARVRQSVEATRTAPLE